MALGTGRIEEDNYPILVKDMEPGLRKLVHVRAKASKYTQYSEEVTDNSTVHTLFSWLETPEGEVFWRDVYYGAITSLKPKKTIKLNFKTHTYL